MRRARACWSRQLGSSLKRLRAPLASTAVSPSMCCWRRTSLPALCIFLSSLIYRRGSSVAPPPHRTNSLPPTSGTAVYHTIILAFVISKHLIIALVIIDLILCLVIYIDFFCLSDRIDLIHMKELWNIRI